MKPSEEQIYRMRGKTVTIVIDGMKLLGVSRIQEEFDKLVSSLEKETLTIRQRINIQLIGKLLDRLEESADDLQKGAEELVENLFESTTERAENELEAEAKAEVYEERCAELEEEIKKLKEGQGADKAAPENASPGPISRL